MPGKRTRRRPARQDPKAAPPRPRGRRRLAGLLLLAAAVGAIIAARPGPHGWHDLGPGLGRIRWIETSTGPTVEPPLAPKWVRDLRARGIPWPTDLLLQPSGASFGASGGAAAWYLVQSPLGADEFWHPDKASIRITDPGGREVPWPGGTGAAAADGDRHYLYLGVPPDLAGKGARLHLRLTRFRGPTSRELALPF